MGEEEKLSKVSPPEEIDLAKKQGMELFNSARNKQEEKARFLYHSL